MEIVQLIELGMATCRVQTGFFHTRTRSAGLDPRPEPGLISKWIFFAGPRPAPQAPRARWAMVLQGPFCDPKKKKFCLILIFSATKQVGEKEHKKIQI